MFTGIVAAIGQIIDVQILGGAANAGVRLSIAAGSLPMDDVRLGDSIAINGACMTVVEKTAQGFIVDVSRASLGCTVGLDQLHEVNLEKALTLADRLGGHLVSGHVDGLGRVHKFAPVGESWELVIDAPQSLAKYLAYKASVVVNGVALTINHILDIDESSTSENAVNVTNAVCRFSINIIPHTMAVTTLKHLQSGDLVNLEVDLIARYVERMLSLSMTEND